MTRIEQSERLHKDKKPAAREFSPREGQRNTGFLNVLLEAAERTMTNEDKTKHLRDDGGSTVFRGGGYDRDADGDIVSAVRGNVPRDDRR